MAKKKTEASKSKSGDSSAKKKSSPQKASAGASKSESSAKQTKTAAKSGKSIKPATAGAGTAPMVDTDLAAQAAAQMLAAGFGRRNRPQTQNEQDAKEGNLIRQLKADLDKDHTQSVSNVLDKGAPQGQRRNTGLPFGQKQVGHNQTFGPDVTRSGVPRRTSG